MAEDLGKKINTCLLKLGKLDIIESCLNKMNSSLANIEHTISHSDVEVKTLSCHALLISTLEERLQNNS